MEINEIIDLLGLETLPEEGGFFRQTHKAKGIIPAEALPNHNGPRAYSTAIYYLVTPESFSALHLVAQNEMFHFYLGDPVEMIQIEPTGELTKHIIGNDLAAGQRPQVLAPADVWQGTRLVEGGKWALLGCTVSPGFEFDDFVLKSRAELTKLFPQHATAIAKYTHG